MVVSYFLFWLATFPDYSVEELDTIDNISWFYICTASFNLVFNLSKLSYDVLIDLPNSYKKLKLKW